MKAKHAAEIRKGILAARHANRNALVILSTRHYSRLAVRAFNITRTKDLYKFAMEEISKASKWL